MAAGLVLGCTYIEKLSAQDEWSVSLLTCDPGDELYSIFGHSALRIKSSSFDYVYNYGTFDFNTPGFYVKFIQGKLPYLLTVSRFEHFMLEYNADKRGVEEQVFSFSEKDKIEMVEFLQWNSLPENAQYPYDFFQDNCSTRIRDVLEKNNEDIIRTDSDDSTYRDLLHRSLSGFPWSRFGIDLIIGSRADQSTNGRSICFLPLYLHDQILSAYIAKENTLLSFPEERLKRLSKRLFTPELVLSLLCIITAFIGFFNRFRLLSIITHTTYLVWTLAGLFIIFLWFFTDHSATKANYNLLWIGIYPVFFYLRNKKWRFRAKNLTALIVLFSALFSLFGILPQAHPSYELAAFLILVTLLDNYILELKWRR